MSRNDFSQLPTAGELQGILSAEIKRALPSGKEDVHYFDFTPLIELAEYFGVPSDSVVRDYSIHEIAEHDPLDTGKKFIEDLKAKLLGKELSRGDVAVCNAAYGYLVEQDEPTDADLIFVFGAKTPLRIEMAIELYKRGYSKLLMVSGRGPHYATNQPETEAQTYAHIAVAGGVPEGEILIENKSTTIPDNVRGSLNLLDEKHRSFESIILVNSPYTQRRGWAHFKKYLPDRVRLVRINSETGAEYKQDTWYKNPKGIDVVLGEYLKAKVAVSLNTA
jgi:hypothetical protein